MIEDKIVEIAEGYIKQNITEIPNNQGWTDRQYMLDMIHYTGWYFGESWCAAAAILIWKKAYEEKNDANLMKILNRLFSLNCQQMGRNFHEDKKWPTNTTKPKIGAIAIFGDGDSSTKGHCGIVVSITGNGKFFTCDEGNTSSPEKPENRNGWTFARHIHEIGKPHSSNGLNFIRFIYPIENY